MSATRNDSLPTVVVPYGYRSIPVLQLAASAEGTCNLVWLIRRADPECVAMERMLRRLGDVVEIDGLDAAAVAAALAPFSPNGVAAFRDDDLECMAELAQRLGLRFHRPEVARALVDKGEQRRALAAGGLAVPLSWEIPARRDRWCISTLVGQASFPAVLKPRQGSGSRHTFLIDGGAQLVETLDALAREPGGLEDMVLEEYLPSGPEARSARFADYVSVETMAGPGGLRHIAVTGRLHQAAPFRETGFFIPSDLGAAATDAVLETATAALEALGVAFGCVHTEIKLTPAGPRVIEVNGRMGGGVAEMLQAAADVDLVRLHLRQAAGEPVEPEGLIHCERVGYRLFHQPPLSAQAVLSVEGLADIAALPGVESVGLHLSAGDPVDARQGTRAFIFSVVGTTAAHAEVADVARRVDELARVTYGHTGADTQTPSELVRA